MNPFIHQLQTPLIDLGFYKGAHDGDFGPQTKAALAAYDETGASWCSLIPLEYSNGEAIALMMCSQLFIRETEGKNQGPGLEKIWQATTYPDGFKNREPYCAAGVAWAVAEAMNGRKKDFALPRSPVAYDFDKWAAANVNRGVQTGIKPEKSKAGDIFTLAPASHCGVILGVKDGALLTCEANTDGKGSREGDGWWLKTRSFSSMRKIHRVL